MRYLCAFLALICLPSWAAADAVLHWNTTALEAIKRTETPAPAAARALAIAHVAMFDAANAIDHRFEFYKVIRSEDRTASVDAAIAYAGYNTLLALFPSQNEWLEKDLKELLKDVPEGPARDAGKLIGERVAERVISIRMNDGVNDGANYKLGGRPGDWRPTLPKFQHAALTQWGFVLPFALSSPSQFRTAGFPPLNSDDYAQEFNQVKSLGAENSAERTPDQTEIAYFWQDGAGTVTLPGHWNRIAQRVAREANQTPLDNARLFALLNVSLADAGIACAHAKYPNPPEFHRWRPIAAIREADTDGNAQTEADPNWLPLLDTPAEPGFPSGHAAFSSAAAGILAHYTGRDQYSLNVFGEGAKNTRTFSSFSEAADEAGRSRIYGGVHFASDVQSGHELGQQIADFVFKGFMKPIDDTVAANEVARRAALRPNPNQQPELNKTFKNGETADPNREPQPVDNAAESGQFAGGAAGEQYSPQMQASQQQQLATSTSQTMICEPAPASGAINITSLPEATTYYADSAAPATSVFYPETAAPATTTYYAPATTTYYSPATTTYYAPATTTAYYAPATTYYQPTTTYSLPTTTYYAPTYAWPQQRAAFYAPQTTVQYPFSGDLLSGGRAVFYAPQAGARSCCGK